MVHRLLAVHAHPDDESSKGAATMAHYVAEGAEVTVVSCTGGEAGSILNEGLAARRHAERDIAGLRRLELAEAQRIIGFRHVWLGYLDSGLPGEGESIPIGSFADIPIEFPGDALIRVIRRTRPQVVVAYDEHGGYPHPDHIRAHEITVWAIARADDSYYKPELGPAWQVQKLYFDRVFHGEKFASIIDAILATDPGDEVVKELEDVRRWATRRSTTPTTRVPVADYFTQRDDALRAHASQVDPSGHFFRWPAEIERQAWPTEDYELVWSKVPRPDDEDDLFAGIEDED